MGLTRFNCSDNQWGNETFMCNGNGLCNILTGACECTRGYTHNLAFNRYRDCSVNVVTFIIFDAIDIIIHFSLFAISLYYARYCQALARQILILISISCFILTIMSAIHLANGGNASIITLLLLNAFFLPGTYMLYSGIFSLIHPLYALTQKDPRPFKRMVDMMFFLYRLASFTLILVYYPYSDFNIIDNDVTWNECVQIYTYLVGLETTHIGIMLTIQSTKMVHLVKTLSHSTLPQPTPSPAAQLPSQLAVDAYVKKVESVKYFVMSTTPVYCIILIGVPTVVLLTGYFPYDWILYMVIVSSNYSATIQFISYSRRQQVNDKVAASPQALEFAPKVDVTNPSSHPAMNHLVAAGPASIDPNISKTINENLSNKVSSDPTTVRP